MTKLKSRLAALIILSGTASLIFILTHVNLDSRLLNIPEFFQYKNLVRRKLSSDYRNGSLISYNANNTRQPAKYKFMDSDIVRKIYVKNDGSDVIVFLRVQKTGSSTLCKHLSTNVDLSPWCNCSRDINNKNCQCLKEWQSKVLLKRTVHDPTCGMHGDYWRLSLCVEGAMNKRHNTTRKRRHLYITMVRDPLRRYLSEWMHVRLHGQWGTSPRKCVTKTTKKFWTNVTLAEFMNCPSNPAINRQVRLISGRRLKQVNASGKLTSDGRMFAVMKSAMENLKNFAYFGITEYQELSQIVFENTFNIRYARGFETLSQRAGRKKDNISESIRQRILDMNRFDVKFFDFAKDLFRQRVLKLIETTQDVQLKDKLTILIKPLFE